jgi:hypothetical protein
LSVEEVDLLNRRFQGEDLRVMTEQELLGSLFDTKPPQIFAESEVKGTARTGISLSSACWATFQ